MTAKDILKQIDKSGLIEYWNKLSNDNQFKQILILCNAEMGVYNPNRSESEIPHIQSERNGGFKAWSKFASKLLNPPTKEALLKSSKEKESDYSEESMI